MKWLITGGCGFIGTSLIRFLLHKEGHIIRVVDNLSVGSKIDLYTISDKFKEVLPSEIDGGPESLELVVGDILDVDLAAKVTLGCDVIVHLAANTGVAPSVENPRIDMLTNVVGTFNYLEASRVNKIPRFIFASSGAPVGEVDPPIHEELAPHPVSPYGSSKLAGEGYCSSYYRTFGLETVALRFGNVYGSGSKHKSSVIAKFIKQALAGEALEVYGDGDQTRDFIFIDDLVMAIFLAATKKGVGGEIFQIATNEETTVNKMVQLLSEVLIEYDVEPVEIIYSDFRLGDVKRNYSDTSKARNILGWTPQHELRQGISNTLAYFLSTKRL